jgi:hypothetical protein
MEGLTGILASGSHAYEGQIVALFDWRIEPLAFYPAAGMTAILG